jgi:cytochrome c-type biogenesis protein
VSVVSFVSGGPLPLAAPVAVAAGLLSFASPCVLPLVPGYLSFVTGLSAQDLSARSRRRRPAPGGVAAGAPAPVPVAVGGGGASTLTVPPPAGGGTASIRPGDGVPDSGWPDDGAAGQRRLGRVTAGTALFVLGFTAVFVSYGAAFGGLGRWLGVHQVGISRALGGVTIVMGLAFAGVFARVPLANREWRSHRLPRPGLLGAPALGVLFGLGWTPCLGPTLSAVLALAVQSATAGRGAFLSAMYCLGLGLPFFAVGLAFRRALGALTLLRRHTRALAIAGGALLVLLGISQVFGFWTDIVTWMRPYAPGFAETPL